MTIAQIEQRLAAIEQKLARLDSKQGAAKRRLTPVEALEAIHGTFEDDDAFREAMRLGRKWRKSLDSKPRRKARSKRK